MVKDTSVKKILKNFFDNASIHSLNYFSKSRTSIYEKIFWVFVNIITTTLLLAWVHYLWAWYMSGSTYVNYEGSIPLQQVEYPGVAICNVNKISKKRALEFAQELSYVVPAKNITSVIEDVKLLGNLYDYNMHRHDRFEAVQELLEMYDKEYASDPTRRIIALTTPCDEMLQRCKWKNEYYPCTDLFLTRMTFDGFCCVFNYVRPMERPYLYEGLNFFDTPTVARSPGGAGTNYGLEVELRNDLDDYFYTTMETTGYKLHIFNCMEFPDLLSGSLSEVLVGAGQQALIGVDVDVIKSVPQIKTIPIRLRKCKFATEDRTTFGMYRNSDCFVECKLRSMQALCDCIPFTVPNSTKYRNICSLIDIPCLNQYSRKWIRYYPHGNTDDTLEFEKHDALQCDCLPTCDSVAYKVYTNLLPMTSGSKNASKINIHFIRSFGNLYKINMSLTWFEVISSYGGLMSLVMGLSLVSIMEILVLFFKIFYCSLYSVLIKK